MFAAGPRQFTSQGNNRLTNGGFGFSHNVLGDHIGTTSYVVTGLADTFNSANDATVFSLREAVHDSNLVPGPEIWLPSWRFILTLAQREYLY